MGMDPRRRDYHDAALLPVDGRDYHDSRHTSGHRDPVAQLAASGTSSESVSLTAPASGTSSESVSLTAPSTPGTHYYGACVDAVTGESDTTNNCSSSVQVTVTAPNKPDLVVYAVLTVTNLPEFGGTGPGGLIQMSVGVENQGGVASPATTVRFYQSTDATITTSDTEVGMDDVGALAASGTSSHGADVTAALRPPGRTTTVPAWTQ